MSNEVLLPKEAEGPMVLNFQYDPNFDPDPKPSTIQGHEKLLEETDNNDDYKKFIQSHGTKWKIFNILSMVMFIGIATGTIFI